MTLSKNNTAPLHPLHALHPCLSCWGCRGCRGAVALFGYERAFEASRVFPFVAHAETHSAAAAQRPITRCRLLCSLSPGEQAVSFPSRCSTVRSRRALHLFAVIALVRQGCMPLSPASSSTYRIADSRTDVRTETGPSRPSLRS